MEKELKSISSNNDWDYYYDTQNIRNQSFVLETEQYFETGARKGFLEPLVFMELFWKQLQYFIKNAHKPHSTLKHFESLLLTAEQKHVLYCFILKFFGGYPLTVSTIDVEQRQPALFLILEAFLRYEGDTPEKEYCRNIGLPKNLNNKLISLEPLPESYQYTGKDFEGFAANNDWDFYHNLDNIRQQEHFIFPIKKYFQSGERAGFIEPLAFMNLYWEQLMKLLQSQNSTRSFTDSLKTLPINEEVRHVLYGWLLKYVGGFPYKNNNLWYDVIFIKIGDAFESYEGNTPEKWFCLREDEREKKINEGIAILDAEVDKEKIKPIKQTSKQVEEAAKPKLKAILKNNFNSMDYEDIRPYFVKLTTLRSKNGEPHLTEEQLNQFLVNAFVEKTIPEPKIKMNFRDGEIGTIRAIFYSYYLACQREHESTRNVKDKYVKLLTDYFQGFKYDAIFNNFNK
ncbi:hypothetical protein [Runella slithyformis]|uniref:Uncharacterized protein n=1 Tax=Runella slithyformis (strain ATCC 29530 / DSM 19594 / LMG 11500 / NCIMB 11436 / LSU 4) TaxID=761193 RepID=A0A7U4E8F9_RUNSL|nr:hypothetical protein [Runella slithyformis]AEI51209.1 hypothetical protein Runsl_4899 [Runella slithyformis DSM 19594]